MLKSNTVKLFIFVWLVKLCVLMHVYLCVCVCAHTCMLCI